MIIVVPSPRGPACGPHRHHFRLGHPSKTRLPAEPVLALRRQCAQVSVPACTVRNQVAIQVESNPAQRKHILNSSGNPGTVQPNTAERSTLRIQGAILVQSDTAERKHIQNSSGNPGTVSSNPAERTHTQIQVGILVQSNTSE